MVAASLGLPSAVANASQTELSTPASSLCGLSSGNVRSLAILHDACRRPTYNLDHWQQHAVRSVIRHLSWTITAQSLIQESVEPIQAQQLALLDSLSVLLTQRRNIQPLEHHAPSVIYSLTDSYHPGLWVAQVQGIRAGPTS